MWRQGVPLPHTTQERILERTHDMPDTDLVLARREEQGAANSAREVASLPQHTALSPCTGKLSTEENYIINEWTRLAQATTLP